MVRMLTMNWMTIATYCWTVILSLCMSTVTSSQCPHNLDRAWSVRQRNGLCYQFINNEVKWDEAHTYCRLRGGYLAEIPDSSTQQFLVSSLRSLRWNRNGVWIGATDHDEEGTWVWDTGRRVTYTNWAPGQEGRYGGWLFGGHNELPPNFLEDCAQIRLSDRGRWHDYPCHMPGYSYSFICQFAAIVPPTTTTTSTTTTTTTTTPLPTTTTPKTTTTTSTTTTTTTTPRPTTTKPTTTTTPTTTTQMPRTRHPTKRRTLPPTTTTTTPTTTTTTPTPTTATSTTTPLPTTTTTVATTKRPTLKTTTTTRRKPTTSSTSTSSPLTTRKPTTTSLSLTTPSPQPTTPKTTAIKRSRKPTTTTTTTATTTTTTTTTPATTTRRKTSTARPAMTSPPFVRTTSRVVRPSRKATSPRREVTATSLKKMTTSAGVVVGTTSSVTAGRKDKSELSQRHGGSSGHELNTGAIVGMVVGATVAVIATALIVTYIYRRRGTTFRQSSDENLAFENYGYGGAVAFNKQEDQAVVCPQSYPESHS